MLSISNIDRVWKDTKREKERCGLGAEVRACVRGCMCDVRVVLCVCVCERERERESDGERERDTERERVTERERERDRETEREKKGGGRYFLYLVYKEFLMSDFSFLWLSFYIDKPIRPTSV